MDHQKSSSASKSNNDEEIELQSALHFAVGQICLSVEREMETKSSNTPQSKISESTFTTRTTETPLSSTTYTRMSTEAISTLTDITFQYVTTSLANDLVSFSQHANRRTINADDVKLVARKDPNKLLAALQAFQEKNHPNSCHQSTNQNSHIREKGRINMSSKRKYKYKTPTKSRRDSSSSGANSNSIVEIDLDSTSSSSESPSESENELGYDDTPLKKKSKSHPTKPLKSDLSDTTSEDENKFELECSSSSDDDNSDQSSDKSTDYERDNKDAGRANDSSSNDE